MLECNWVTSQHTSFWTLSQSGPNGIHLSRLNSSNGNISAYAESGEQDLIKAHQPYRGDLFDLRIGL